MLALGLPVEVALFVLGARAIVRKQFPISRSREVVGRAAVCLGALALTPVPLAAVAGACYAWSEDPAKPIDLARAAATLNLIELVIAVAVAFVVFVTGIIIAVRPEQAESHERVVRTDDENARKPRNR